MPEYVQFNPVSGRITNKWYSADPSIVEGLSNILKISRSVYRILTRFHIVDSGVIRGMTQSEKDALLAAEEQARIDAENLAISRFEITQLEVLTALIKRINVRIPSNPITKQEIIDQIKADR